MNDDLTLTDLIRQGRGYTANFGGFSGTDEFWNCVKRTPAPRAHECIPYLLPEKSTVSEKIMDQLRVPVSVELKEGDWLWLALGGVMGFIIAWIIKR